MDLKDVLADPEPPPSSDPPDAQLPLPPPPPAPPSDLPPTSAPTMPPKRKADALTDDGAATPKTDTADAGREGDAVMTTSIRTNKNGATSSVYSGNKIRHLKKEDGIPLWRKDIQYDFLKLVFYDDTKCFTKYSDRSKGHTFADVYIDAMAKSSKCSKILKEKLLHNEQGALSEGAISMAMVCLLVNVGRMNTTLNFFPEMRAQLRTYHSIPALQAHQDVNAYKQLQDAPRLKSILKGATEDEPQPSTIEDIRAASIPRTNPVNLIFVMSQFALKITEVHFPSSRDFFDLVMRPSLSSESRAKAFLWLIWWYLESDFSAQDSQRNPFGPGQYGEGEEGTDALPVRVPTLETLTEEQAAEENVDTEAEQHFGEVKRKERIAILASEPSPAMTALKRARKEKGLTTGHNPAPSDDEGSETGYHRTAPTSVGKSALYHETGSEYTRSPSPAAGRGFQAVNTKSGGMGINNLLNSDHAAPEQSPPHTTPVAPPVKKGPGRGNWRRNRNKDANAGASATPVPLLPNTGQVQFVNNGPSQMAKSGQANFNFGQTTLAATTGMSPGQNISFQSPSTLRDHIPTPSYQAQKRHRGVTQHQTAVISHRKMQIDYNLDRRIRKAHAKARDKREAESAVLRAWKRIRHMQNDYDSEEEAIRIRKARKRADVTDEDWRAPHRGRHEDDFMDNVDYWRRPQILYAGFRRVNGERSDVGEEAKSLAQSFRRCSRRLQRWQDTDSPGHPMKLRETRQEFGPTSSRPSRKPSLAHDGLEVVERDEDGAAEGSQRRRQRHRGHHQRRHRGEVEKGGPRRRTTEDKMEDKMDVDGEPDDEDDEDGDDDGRGRGGGVELNEEDRELLGEVDADEDEEDGDGDEEGDDDD